MRTVLFLAMLLAQTGPASEKRDDHRPASPAEIDAIVAEHEKVDIASQMNESAEAKQVLLSARMYLAIKGVQTYRDGSQKADLTASERKFENFDIMVVPGAKSTWLRGNEKQTHFEVMVSPRFLVNEEVTLHGRRVLGRSISYAVRKTDFKVTRAEFDKY